MQRLQFQVRVPRRSQPTIKDLNSMLAACKIKYGIPTAYEVIYELAKKATQET